jgi:hypothetical protein
LPVKKARKKQQKPIKPVFDTAAAFLQCSQEFIDGLDEEEIKAKDACSAGLYLGLTGTPSATNFD